jgi:hypothetical protein
MEHLPIQNEFIEKNQERFAALRLLAQQSLLNPENRLTITADESLNMEIGDDMPEGPVVKKFLDINQGDITDEIRQEIIEVDKKAQTNAAMTSIRTSITEVAMHMIAIGPKTGANVDSSVWPPFSFENVSHYEKTSPDGVTINLTEIKGIQDISDAIRLRVEVEDGIIAKSLHLLCIDGQTIYAVMQIKPANDEQLVTWFKDIQDHANEIAEILMHGFKKPIDELEPKIDDLSDRLLDEDYSPDYVSRFTKEIYDRIIAMKSQIEMQAHTDITTPNQEDIDYFETMLSKIK